MEKETGICNTTIYRDEKRAKSVDNEDQQPNNGEKEVSHFSHMIKMRHPGDPAERQAPAKEISYDGAETPREIPG